MIRDPTRQAVLSDGDERLDYVVGKYSALLHDLHSVPDADTLVHNDLHLGNVPVHNGEWMIIDLDEISMGYPSFDLGVIYATCCAFYENGIPGREDRAEMEEFHRFSWETSVRMRHDLLRRYYPGISEEKAAEVEEILGFIGYLRLLSYLSVRPGFTADVPKIANAVRRLKEMLTGLDTLAYEV